MNGQIERGTVSLLKHVTLKKRHKKKETLLDWMHGNEMGMDDDDDGKCGFSSDCGMNSFEYKIALLHSTTPHM